MQDLVTMIDVSKKLKKFTPPKEAEEKKEKSINLKSGTESEVRNGLLKATGYGSSLSMTPTYIYQFNELGKQNKMHEGYLIKTNHDQDVSKPYSDNWGSLKVVARLSDFTHQQWNNIIFSFISDSQRDRDRLKRISKTGQFRLDRASFLETNIVNYEEEK